MKEYVDIKIQGVHDTINVKMKGVNDTINEMNKRLSLIASLVIALVALVILAVGVPATHHDVAKQRGKSTNRKD